MGIIDEWRQLRDQWPMARRYGYRRDLVFLALSSLVERFWLCRVRDVHRVKFSSAGRCIRCGRQVAA